MRQLKGKTIRLFSTAFLATLLAGAIVFVCIHIIPSEADIAFAAAALVEERRPPEKRDPHYAWPDVTRWHFVTHLPVPGRVNAYRWRARGEYACSLDPNRDRLINFRLDTPNANEPITLISPLAVFDKKARLLLTEAATHVSFSWGTVDATHMQLDLETTNAVFDDDVIVDVIETQQVGLFTNGTPADEPATDAGNDADDDEAGAEAAEAATAPLRITADHFEICSAENTGVFIGHVVAKDGAGTIRADKMVVEYYSAEEKQANPTRTGMKRITCTGHVCIDQKTEQAICDQADYDVENDTIVLDKSENAQVLYRKDDGKEKVQILADHVEIDRKPGGKTKFSGDTETVDFSETRESFFDLSKDEPENTDPEDGEPARERQSTDTE